jgi:O-antigen/teichoic acid export membrane protein
MKLLRKKIVHGLIWNAFNVFARQGLTLFVHIILARLLFPADFGIIGMITVFLDLSHRLQGAGLGESLTRKKTADQEEYNFVFYYGLFVGLICYAALFILAPAIAAFYSEPQLVLIIRIIAINLILTPLRGINQVQLVKQLKFNLIAKIEITTSISAGLIAIYLAYTGWGVWSLVIQHISLGLISLGLLLATNFWLPSARIDYQKSRQLFSYGSKFMVSNFIQTGFSNIYHVVIGKQYTADILGSYTQGIKLVRLPSNAVNAIIQTVSFPVFAHVHDDKVKYRSIFQKNLRLLTFINFPMLITLATMSDPLIPFLLSDKWTATIPFFQILVLVGLMDPVKSLFTNVLKVEGQGGQLIRYVLLGKLFFLAGILITVRINVHVLVISQSVAAFLELLLFSRIGRYIDYRFFDFVKDTLPNLFIGICMGFGISILNQFTHFSGLITLLLDGILALIIRISLSVWFNNPSFIEIKTELRSRYFHKAA